VQHTHRPEPEPGGIVLQTPSDLGERVPLTLADGDHVDGNDRLLSDVLDVHLAGVSVKQNEDMRKISAWVAMAAVPTLIAGIYGMNFDNMPELNMSVAVGGSQFYYGYFLVLVVMATIITTLYRMFKRSGWL
jgi:magnesium transporter